MRVGMARTLEEALQDLEYYIKEYSADFDKEKQTSFLAAEALIDSIDLFLYDLEEQKHFLSNFPTLQEVCLKMINALRSYSRSHNDITIFKDQFNQSYKLYRAAVAKEMHDQEAEAKREW